MKTIAKTFAFVITVKQSKVAFVLDALLRDGVRLGNVMLTSKSQAQLLMRLPRSDEKILEQMMDDGHVICYMGE